MLTASAGAPRFRAGPHDWKAGQPGAMRSDRPSSKSPPQWSDSYGRTRQGDRHASWEWQVTTPRHSLPFSCKIANGLRKPRAPRRLESGRSSRPDALRFRLVDIFLDIEATIRCRLSLSDNWKCVVAFIMAFLRSGNACCMTRLPTETLTGRSHRYWRIRNRNISLSIMLITEFAARRTRGKFSSLQTLDKPQNGKGISFAPANVVRWSRTRAAALANPDRPPAPSPLSSVGQAVSVCAVRAPRRAATLFPAPRFSSS